MLRRFVLGVVLSAACVGTASAASPYGFSDITSWTGTGSNQAAMVFDWSSPEVFNYTSVPAPGRETAIAFGYRFNGTPTAETMFNAIVAANPCLYAVMHPDARWGDSIEAIGYHPGAGEYGVTDGLTPVITQASFVNGILDDSSSAAYNFDADHSYASNAGDAYWGGHFGPDWQLWTEHGGLGGFTNEPDRGNDTYWTADPGSFGFSGSHGQWDLAGAGISSLTVTQGSWLGWTVNRGGDNWMDDSDPGTVAWTNDKQAPVIVPEPASVGLLICGGAALLGRRKGRHSR